MQNKNILLAIAVWFLFSAGWMKLGQAIWPVKPPIIKDDRKARVDDKAPIKDKGKEKEKEREKIAVAQGPVIPAPAPPTPDNQLIRLGYPDEEQADNGNSRFHLQVLLDPRGAGVRSVVLNKFQKADEMGRPESDPATKRPVPLELVPAEANADYPSNLLFHFRGIEDSSPLEALGKAAWKHGQVEKGQTDDGRERERVSFQTEVAGVRIAKTFTLIAGEYHIGMEVSLSRSKSEEGSRKFRYQLSGSHGLPIEGRWYTSTFRNALIARGEGSNVYRELEEGREIASWLGGTEILAKPGQPIRYAGVAVQYFASMIVVDNEQEKRDFLKQARPTLETAVARGVVQKIDREQKTFEMPFGEKVYAYYLADDQGLRDKFSALKENSRLAVVYHMDGRGRAVVTQLTAEMGVQPLWVDDITVRVSTEAIELKPGDEVTHKYLLYNGPVKPKLLSRMSGAAEVSPDLVDRYVETLQLNKMTDHHSPNFMGKFANFIYWSQLIIIFTNVMHWILAVLHYVVPSYGICIVLLTVIVRGSMFPLSRKQALMTQKMQEVAPEMKKIQDKYKDDPQGKRQAQMDLYKKHGVSPQGTCFLLLLQMPVFMGLYFALQESIQFRLAPFWPTWIINLAAPDMLFEWGDGIWMLSRPEDYGGLLYLGPYFNLLPIVAVLLMLVQQKMMTPPATNEEEAMRNAMMKYMMIFMGLMFYKVASGLCLYFIASSVWGFAERKLLPKAKLKSVESSDGLLQKVLGNGKDISLPGVADGPGKITRARKKAERARDDNSTLGRLRAWWQNILDQAEKK